MRKRCTAGPTKPAQHQYVLQQDHVVASKITAVRCGGTLLLIPYPSMIGSADAGVVVCRPNNEVW